MEAKLVNGSNISDENPISRVPPEVWDRITKNVTSSKDLVNVYKAIPICEELLHPKRSEWLFYQVLPILITNTHEESVAPDRKDLLNCRRVCKHWKFGVDNFLENNVVHYPASGDELDWKLNRCHFSEAFYLNQCKIICNKPFKNNKIKKMITEAVNHPNNPIVGRSVYLDIPKLEHSTEDIALIKQFIENFGSHIYFLRLDFVKGSHPIQFIQILLKFLPNLPNLKGLAINNNSWNYVTENCEENYIIEELNITKRTICTEEFRNRIPELETLDLQIDGLVGDFLKQMIVEIFSYKNLKSLTLMEFLNSGSVSFDFQNLLRLCLHIDNNVQLWSILDLNCPKIRKFELHLMYEELDYDLLYILLKKFQRSLSNLSLHLPDVLEISDKVEHKKMIRFFTTPNILKIPNLKTISLFGWRPPSLNFICGDNFSSLEYLNLYLDNGEEEENPLLEYPLPNVKFPEIVDMLQRLTPMWSEYWSMKQPEIYKSNVWTLDRVPKTEMCFTGKA